MRRKYFQIGFHKCGTTSISRFFHMNGFSCIDFDDGRIARRMKENLDTGTYILSGYDEYDVFTDMISMDGKLLIEGYKFFRELYEQVDGAMFILNVRDRDIWIRSRVNWRHAADHFKAYYGISETSDLIARWERDWDEHLKAVQDFLPSECLLVFNIETDSPLRLCEFAGLEPAAARHYTQHNVSLSRFGQFFASCVPSSLKTAVPHEWKRPIRHLLRRRS